MNEEKLLNMRMKAFKERDWELLITFQMKKMITESKEVYIKKANSNSTM